MLTGETIKNDHADVFTFLTGNLQTTASHCEIPEQALTGILVYASTSDQAAEALLHRPAILIIASHMCGNFDAAKYGDTCCFSVCDIAMGIAKLLKYFDQKRFRFTQWGERHPTAVVHAEAKIGEGVFLGPYCVIGAAALIGDGCEIGEDCEIHPHSTIGSDGFGYSVGPDGRPLKISHLGNVKIGDKVEIGSNCAVDRATLTSAHIRSGTKLDNLCHVAHNCDLGEDGLYTAGFMTGGSTKIGRQFATGGGTVVTAHVTLTDNVVLAGRSTVTNDIHKAGRYGGYPLQPLKQAMKTVVSIGQLNELRRNLNRVMKHLRLVPETIR